MEKTLILVKPDGVSRGLTGEIIRRFELRGFQIIGLKMLQFTRNQAERHYQDHSGKAFFEKLLAFITSGPVVAFVVKGENAIVAGRNMIGSTDPLRSAPGTIRGDFATSMSSNVVHASDSIDAAEREIDLLFSESELYVTRS